MSLSKERGTPFGRPEGRLAALAVRELSSPVAPSAAASTRQSAGTGFTSSESIGIGEGKTIGLGLYTKLGYSLFTNARSARPADADESEVKLEALSGEAVRKSISMI